MSADPQQQSNNQHEPTITPADTPRLQVHNAFLEYRAFSPSRIRASSAPARAPFNATTFANNTNHHQAGTTDKPEVLQSARYNNLPPAANVQLSFMSTSSRFVLLQDEATPTRGRSPQQNSRMSIADIIVHRQVRRHATRPTPASSVN